MFSTFQHTLKAMADPSAPYFSLPLPEENPYQELGEDFAQAQEKPRPPRGEANLSNLLQSQLQLAEKLQEKILDGGLTTLPPRELKELVNSVSTLLTLAHRTGQADQEIQTYKLYVSVVNDFLRRRSDALGEDLAEELRVVAREYAGAPMHLM